MADIRLARGKGIALIDEEDAARIPPTGWYRHPHGYAAAHTPMVRGKRTGVLLHRLVMNAPVGTEIDHVNHNKLDCRKANLRFVTRSQNNQNWSGASTRSRTGIRGVISYQTRKGVRFRASVELSGKAVYRFGLLTLAEAEATAIELRRTHFTHAPECRS